MHDRGICHNFCGNPRSGHRITMVLPHISLPLQWIPITVLQLLQTIYWATEELSDSFEFIGAMQVNLSIFYLPTYLPTMQISISNSDAVKYLDWMLQFL